MIHIQVFRDNLSQIQSVEVSGHAGYAEPGEDIVCAAVSAQVISIENSLTRLLNLDMTTEVDEEAGGYLKLTLPKITSKQITHDAQLLLKHLEFALEVLSENYPEYVQIQQFNL